MLKKIFRSLIPKLPIILPAVAVGMLLLSEVPDPISSLLSKTEEEQKEELILEMALADEKQEEEVDGKGKEAGENGQEASNADGSEGENGKDIAGALSIGGGEAEGNGESEKPGEAQLEGIQNESGNQQGSGEGELREASEQEDANVITGRAAENAVEREVKGNKGRNSVAVAKAFWGILGGPIMSHDVG